MDSLLRRSLSAPVPSLSPGFDERLSREVRRGSQPLNPKGRMLLAGYGLLSAAVCVVVMHGQGLGWEAIALMTLGPLALVAAARAMGRTKLGHSVR
jgi:hypothetical protein